MLYGVPRMMKFVGRVAPDLAQPVDVGLESACRHHSGPGADRPIAAAGLHGRGTEPPIGELEADHLGVVDDPNPETLRSGVVAVHQRLAAAQKERVGARQMQRAAQGRLKAHTESPHPLRTARRRANDQTRERFVGLGPLTRSRSETNSSSEYESVRSRPGPVCMHRKLRVWRLFPPRKWRGALSTTMTRAPASRAVSAAHSPALPPPSTATS